ncbi:calpain-C [Schistocerca piceifrons]|uniref:calpain-C n=1 Tax=Schistocerca piceifrons TaxID=274613 RepID=UPI001F5EBA9A|nr:calpain-C [Schistocerca piceifrons]XP_049785147.1 calpain-C [Schistocerca cancellata]XP_049829578.1 calpain-C [Schistocerca gregaria]XP_049960489.1 calpain-C [Schistocerca serialis cubense]
MTDYERIKRSCLKRGELWEDPDFPATQSSVFYHQTPPFQFVWKRPKELSPRPVFVHDAPAQFDIVPGKMGDRWLVSCLGVLYLSKGLFYRVVPADQTFEQYAGVFRFRLWWCGEWLEVLVDDRLPTVHGRLAFLQAQHSDQFWPGLLEKAYAKLHGSYEALKYGTLLDGLADLTGGITESVGLRQDATTCGRVLAKLLDMTSLVTCTVQPATTQVRNQVEKLANGIHIGTNYRLYAIERVETFNGEPVQLVRLRNPLGPGGEYVGAWARDSPEWDEVPPSEKERLNVRHMGEGEFWISYSDFVKTFTHLEVVHLDSDTSRDEPSLHHKNTWQMRLYQGSWRRGVTAGGCRNNPDTFHINPQLHLILSEMEEVIISLNQHSIMEPKVIGFTAYSLPKNSTETIGKTFFKKNKSLVNSQYTNSRQVSHRCQLEQGGYLVLPTTFEPSQESSFTLRVYSSKPLKLKLLDIHPSLVKSAIIKAPPLLDGKSFSQYEAVFLQLADEHRTVNAFELQELLDACLPNDYIKSCACMEVCRQVVLTLDTSGSGRLKFNDFKDLMCSLKYWQIAFKNHTKEKTGILKAERLRDALLEVGFQLNTDVLSILILRYMRKDGTLRFGDFVSAILHLTVAFNVFESKDPLQNGSIKLSLAEWLKTSLMC